VLQRCAGFKAHNRGLHDWNLIGISSESKISEIEGCRWLGAETL
jgi:hypothetical protein